MSLARFFAWIRKVYPASQKGHYLAHGGVYDLRMDRGTLFLLPKLAALPTFMMNFSGELAPCLKTFGPKNPPIWVAHTSMFVAPRDH